MDIQPDESDPIDWQIEVQFVDPITGLRLNDPFPEYLGCPSCGEPEVEVWCYQDGAHCHNCGHWIKHTPAACCGVLLKCNIHKGKVGGGFKDGNPSDEAAP